MGKTTYRCKHPFPVQIVENRYVICLQCGKRLAEATGRINTVLDEEDYLNKDGWSEIGLPK